jgi:hypothetical protein
MTVENLHDAIGQLSSDLITAVDKKRSRKRTTVPFKRYLAMAACAALMLCGTWVFAMTQTTGGAKDAAMAAPEMQAADRVTNSPVNAPAAKAPEEEAAPMEAAPEEPAAVAGESGAGETFHAGEIPPENFEKEAFEAVILSLSDIQYAPTRNIGTAATTSEPMIKVLHSTDELEALRQKLGYYTMENFDACVPHYDDVWFESHDLLVVVVKSLYSDGTLALDSVTESDGSWCVKFYSGGPHSGQREDRFIFAGVEKGVISEGSHLFAMFEVP